MNIISKEEKNGRLLDGIETLLNLDEQDFNMVIKRLTDKERRLEDINFYYTTDKCELPSSPFQLGLEKETDENGNRICRYYFGGERYALKQIFQELEKRLQAVSSDSLEYSRIDRLLATRNLEAFKQRYNDGTNGELLDKIFGILESDERLEKFIDFENNREEFSIGGIPLKRKEYLECLAQFFGQKNEKHKDIYTSFYIPEIEDLRRSYEELLSRVNMDRYTDPHYEFRTGKGIVDQILRKGEEPTWELNPEIYGAIYTDMPGELSLEEKAMYIYCKMCQIFSYDEGYLYRDKIKQVNFGSTFSKEHLEALTPNSKITCYDFSRIFAKLINELPGDIEAVLIAEGMNEGHFYAGFYTDKVSAYVEAVNVNSSKDPTNDLMKAKNGIILKGITPISDREKILPRALDKAFKLALKKEPKTIGLYMEDLKSLPREEVSDDDTKEKLETFLEVMKTNNVSGNEFVLTLMGVARTSFFGSNLEKAFLGEREESNGKTRYKRKVLIRKNNEGGAEELYLIDSESLELSICTREEMIRDLTTEKYIYEKDEHKIPGIDKEEK